MTVFIVTRQVGGEVEYLSGFDYPANQVPLNYDAAKHVRVSTWCWAFFGKVRRLSFQWDLESSAQYIADLVSGMVEDSEPTDGPM